MYVLSLWTEGYLMICSCSAGSNKLEEREAESPRGGMDVGVFFTAELTVQ